MPTAPQLLAAVLFAGLAWLAGEFVKLELPEGEDPGYLSEVSALFAFILGWKMMNMRTVFTVGAGIGSGISCSIAVFVVCTGFQAGYEMILNSLKTQYDGATEAVIDMFVIFGEFALIALVPSVIATLLIGGAVAGMLVYGSKKRWN